MPIGVLLWVLSSYRMWFKNLSGRMGQNLRNLSKLTEKAL